MVDGMTQMQSNGPEKPDERAEAGKKWAEHSKSLERARARLAQAKEEISEAQGNLIELALMVGRLEGLESDSAALLRRLMR